MSITPPKKTTNLTDFGSVDDPIEKARGAGVPVNTNRMSADQIKTKFARSVGTGSTPTPSIQKIKKGK